MKKALEEDVIYPYLKPNAVKRLQTARRVAQNTDMLNKSLVHLGGYSYCLFPWLGTRSFRTLRKYIKQHADAYGISGVEFEGCYYIQFKMEKSNPESFVCSLMSNIERYGINCSHLVESGEIPVFEKFDSHVPASLLRKAYAADKLRADEAENQIKEIYGELNI